MARNPTVVVDTSTWIDFFARGNDRLRRALETTRAFVHPWVVYELELGSGVPARERFLIARLPRVEVVTDVDVWRFAQPVRGSGLGWVDVHLLAATSQSGFALMTNDRPLQRAARRLGVPTVT